MKDTKKIATLGVLTALYVVMSAFLKFTVFSNIMVDLGYIVFTFALCMFGMWGTVVGVVGCALESILFSAYGFSISWVMANLAIGLICGHTLNRRANPGSLRYAKFPLKFIVIVVGTAIGMLVVKTAIECYLYSIPLAVKIPKNAIAFVVDAVTMIIGLVFYENVKHRIPRKTMLIN